MLTVDLFIVYLLSRVDIVIRYIEVDFTFGLPDYVCDIEEIFTIQYPVPLFSLCTKSLIAVLKDAKQLSEENGGGPFC